MDINYSSKGVTESCIFGSDEDFLFERRDCMEDLLLSETPGVLISPTSTSHYYWIKFLFAHWFPPFTLLGLRVFG